MQFCGVKSSIVLYKTLDKKLYDLLVHLPMLNQHLLVEALFSHVRDKILSVVGQNVDFACLIGCLYFFILYGCVPFLVSYYGKLLE